MNQSIKWLLGLFSTGLLLILVLCFGNPQWNRFVYCWQAYILKKNVWANFGYINRPKDYVGIWRDWDRNLKISMSMVWGMGIGVGETCVYHDGELYTREVWKAPPDTPQIEYWEYYENGQLKQHDIHPENLAVVTQSFYEDGRPHQVTTLISPKNDKLRTKTYYESGQLSTSYISDCKRGNIDGEILFYNENGDLTERRFYELIPSTIRNRLKGLSFMLDDKTLKLFSIHFSRPKEYITIFSVDEKIDEREKYKHLIKGYPELLK